MCCLFIPTCNSYQREIIFWEIIFWEIISDKSHYRLLWLVQLQVGGHIHLGGHLSWPQAHLQSGKGTDIWVTPSTLASLGLQARAWTKWWCTWALWLPWNNWWCLLDRESQKEFFWDCELKGKKHVSRWNSALLCNSTQTKTQLNTGSLQSCLGMSVILLLFFTVPSFIFKLGGNLKNLEEIRLENTGMEDHFLCKM